MRATMKPEFVCEMAEKICPTFIYIQALIPQKGGWKWSKQSSF